MAAGKVPTANLTALYNNTTPGSVADPAAVDNAVQDIVQTINDNFDKHVLDISNHASSATLAHPDGSVTRLKLADKAVGAGQLDDAAVTPLKMSAESKDASNHTYSGTFAGVSTSKQAIDELYNRFVQSIQASSVFEVSDARIGTDNAIYPTLKDRLDWEIDAVNTQLVDKATLDQLTELKLEVDNLELGGGTTIPTLIRSYDEYFSIATPDPSTAYYLDATKKAAVSQFLTKRKAKLLVYQNEFVPSEGEPIRNGLQIWVDSKYKDNLGVNKTVYNDLSGNLKNGSMLGFTFDGTSGWNDGLLFDGVDDKVQFSANLGANGFSFEVMLFVPASGFIVNTRIVNANSDYLNLYSGVGGKLELKLSTQTRPNIPFNSLLLDEYNHIAGTCDFTTGDIKLYLNGVLVSTATNAPFTFSLVNTLFLGSFNTTLHFAGKQKLFRYYNRPLSAVEVKHNYDLSVYEEDVGVTVPPPPPPPTSTNEKYSLYNPLFIPRKARFIGHRGLGGLQPENTIPSFEECGKKGIWGVETDIRKTSDGVFVCMHDATIDRTTTGTGNVADLTLAQIKSYTIDFGVNIGSYTGLTVPTLKEMLAACSKYGLVPLLHLYTAHTDVPALVSEVNALGFEKTVMYASTSTVPLKNINQLSDSIVLGLGGATTDLSAVGGDGMFNYVTYTDYTAFNNYPDAIKLGHQNKQIRIAWVINDLATAKDFFDRGIDGIATDSLYSLD